MPRRSPRSTPTLLAAVAGLLAVALPALADPPARVGRLSEISGTVSFHDSADEQWSPATLNYPVTSGNSFWTEPNARAEINLGSTAIHLDGSTELDITALDDKHFEATMPQGTINIRVTRFDNGDGYNIATPRGTVSLASPGTYRIAAGNDSEPTRIAVLEGAAQISDPDSTVTLTRGEEAVLSGTDHIDTRIAEAQPTPFDDASLARERRDEAASRPAARYVSPEMTGYQDLDDHGAWQTDPTYGAVWYPQAVPVDWAPYRYGHWRWVDPWGWTWIDDQPWGFAPFHYGRWAYIHDRWGWTPGRFVARPVYAPALVAFVGGAGWSASLSFGNEPCVGWFPLAPREVYVPSYPASVTYVRNVNVTHVTNITNITNQTINNVNVTNVHHANQRFATVVPQNAFVAAHPVSKAALRVPTEALDKAPVATGAPLTPAVAAASGRQEAVSRAIHVAQARGERVDGPPPQAAAKPAAIETGRPAPGPAIAAHGKPPANQAQGAPGQPGQRQIGQVQPGQAQPAQAQSGQPQAARPPERGAPVWVQNRPPAAAAAPGPPIAPHTGTAAPAPRTPANETAQARSGGAPQPQAAAPGPPIAPHTGTAAASPHPSGNETAEARPSGTPQPPPAAGEDRVPAAQNTPVGNAPVQNAPSQSAPARTAQPQPATPTAPPPTHAAVAPPAPAAAPPRPAATASVPPPVAASHPPVTAHAPTPPAPERTVQRPVQQTVLQPTHQGWVRQPPPAAPPQPHAAPQQAAQPKPAPAAKPAPAPAGKSAPAPAQQPQQQHSNNGRPSNPPEPKHANG